MSAKYLLPCHDGRTVEVTTADAGRMIACPCGKQVQVPTLRGLRELTPAGGADSLPAAPTWSAQQGAMFTIGLCLLLAALAASGLFYNRWRKIETIKPEVDAEFLVEMQKIVDKAEPASMLDAWHSLRNSPLPEERGTLPWESNRAEARQYMIYMSIAGAMAAIGLALAVIGPWMRPSPSMPPKRKVAMKSSAH